MKSKTPKAAKSFKSLRTKAKISQNTLAEMLDIANGQSISNVEGCRMSLPCEWIKRASEVFGASDSVLINAMVQDYKDGLIETVNKGAKR